MSACNRPKSTALRAALVSSVAFTFLVGFMGPQDAAAYRAKATTAKATSASAKKPKPEKDGFGGAANGVLQIVVSIGSQHATLFSNKGLFAEDRVSTGMKGHPTPMGVFSIIQKHRMHHSNIYSGAPMPYMQRITWSGAAIHEGVLPGHPASHGCIRTSHAFASALWPVTKLGVRVLVTRNDLSPADFSHPSLFVPRPKPPEPAVAMLEPKPQALVQIAQSTTTAKDDGGLDVTPTAVEAVKPAPTDDDPPKPAAPTGKRFSQPVKRTGQVAVFVSRKEQKIFVRQSFGSLFEMPVTIDEMDRPLGTHVFTALGPQADGSGMRWNLFTIPTGPERAVEKQRTRGKSREPVKPVIVESKASSTAAEALNRIHMPKEAVDRISELLVPGSSLVVSDKGNSYETGAGTEFIVLVQ
jgi:L,D-transpeptidase catalytic domain